jgi:uncharacterized protein (DUF1778 family)
MKRTETLPGIRCTKEERDILEAAAAADRRTLSDFLRKILFNEQSLPMGNEPRNAK